MFRLGKKVRGNIGSVACLICDYKNLAWSSWNVYSHVLAYFQFCGCHKNVSWSHDLVCLWYRTCTVRHGSYGLCSSNPIYFTHSRNVSSNQKSRINISTLSGWRTHNNIFDPSYLGGYGTHQHRRRIGSFSSRNVDANR